MTGQSRRVVVGGISWRATFATLKHRDFRLCFVGQLVSLIGTWMQNTAQSWLVDQLIGSNALLVNVKGNTPPIMGNTFISQTAKTKSLLE